MGNYLDKARQWWFQRTAHDKTTFRILAILALIAATLGIPSVAQDWRGFLGNLSAGFIGSIVTYWLIDRIIGGKEQQEAEARQKHQEKDRLIREMGNPDHGIALRALAELRASGWIENGSLANLPFQHLNLAGGNLQNANLQGADLYLANLEDANLSSANLKWDQSMRRAIATRNAI